MIVSQISPFFSSNNKNNNQFGNSLHQYYTQCIISGKTEKSELRAVRIIPTNICRANGLQKFSNARINGLLVHKDIYNLMEKMELSFLPEIIRTFYVGVNKFAIIKCYCKDNKHIIHGKQMIIDINSLFFIKWHFLNFLEKNWISVTMYDKNKHYNISAKDYLKKVVSSIQFIDGDTCYDREYNTLMLHSDP
jgi:hypothetical protein